ncbi:MerR family transcriptional regulator [Deinococcus malanensis]|uniref:MerR family transcriptional regulator n=1 Tax=Deinococcus malanensis TaxID=1706855 RepID=UPI00363DA5E9
MFPLTLALRQPLRFGPGRCPMTGTQLWTVGEVAELTRVSVRTLHHYDALGLLMPSVRSEANYRLYAPDDLSRLWRILTFRELGFPFRRSAGCSAGVRRPN